MDSKATKNKSFYYEQRPALTALARCDLDSVVHSILLTNKTLVR